MQLGRAKNRKNGPKIILSTFLEVDAAVRAGLGGRIIGWGEACLGLNFKPYLKVGLKTRLLIIKKGI